MNLIGSKVKHAKFGVGVIVQVSEYVKVDFDGIEKKFLLETFDKFFSFEDEKAHNFVKELIKKIKAEKEAEATRKAEEERLAQQAISCLIEEKEPLKTKRRAKKVDNFKGLEIKDGVLIGLGSKTRASIVIPDCVTSIGEKAFSIDGVFGYGYRNITIPDSVISIGESAFAGCDIKTLTIGKGVKEIDIMAFSYARVEKVNYLGTIDEWVQIDFGDLYSNPTCWSGKLYIDNKLVDNIKLLNTTKINSSALEQLRFLKNLSVDENNPNYKTVDGNLYTKDGKALIKYASLKDETSFAISDEVEVISSGCFSGAKSLENLTICKSIKAIYPTAFDGCSSLKKVNYLGSINEWVNIDMGCTQDNLVNNPLEYAKNLYINGELVENVIISNVKKIKMNVFSGCKSIKTVKIEEGVETIEHQAFCDCSALVKVEIPTTVKIETDCFLNCDKLEIIKK